MQGYLLATPMNGEAYRKYLETLAAGSEAVSLSATQSPLMTGTYR